MTSTNTPRQKNSTIRPVLRGTGAFGATWSNGVKPLGEIVTGLLDMRCTILDRFCADDGHRSRSTVVRDGKMLQNFVVTISDSLGFVGAWLQR